MKSFPLAHAPHAIARSLALSFGLWLAALSACTESEPSTGPQVEITVAPLDLPGVADVVYRLTVENGASPSRQTVFERTIRSTRFGDGRGAASYVGPCDASPDANDNRVTLEILAIDLDDGTTLASTDWVNPTPVSLNITCLENQDVPVTFNLVVMRNANQGFFDIAVNFNDIFCSAKLDCQYDGDPIELLFNEGVRDTTVVVAWICTSGAGETTWLYMDPVVVSCTDGTQFTIAQNVEEGNQGGQPPFFFESAVYSGQSMLQGQSMCYVNTAIGVNVDNIPAGVDCTVTTAATAADALWPGPSSPVNTVYPYISWDVPIIIDGELACTNHPVNVTGSGVETQYTSTTTVQDFSFGFECGGTGGTVGAGVVCDTAQNVLPGMTSSVRFSEESPGFVQVRVGAQTSEPMQLPAGLSLADSCCQDVCCF